MRTPVVPDFVVEYDEPSRPGIFRRRYVFVAAGQNLLAGSEADVGRIRLPEKHVPRRVVIEDAQCVRVFVDHDLRTPAAAGLAAGGDGIDRIERVVPDTAWQSRLRSPHEQVQGRNDARRDLGFHRRVECAVGTKRQVDVIVGHVEVLMAGRRRHFILQPDVGVCSVHVDFEPPAFQKTAAPEDADGVVGERDDLVDVAEVGLIGQDDRTGERRKGIVCVVDVHPIVMVGGQPEFAGRIHFERACFSDEYRHRSRIGRPESIRAQRGDVLDRHHLRIAGHQQDMCEVAAGFCVGFPFHPRHLQHLRPGVVRLQSVQPRPAAGCAAR